MKRRQIHQLTLGAASAIAVPSLALAQTKSRAAAPRASAASAAQPEQSPDNPVAGRIDKTEGYVRLIGGQGDRTASSSVLLYEGDRILTSANSDAVVRMADGAVVAVRPNSELLVAAYRFSAREPREGSVLLELVRGGLRAITGLVGKANPSAVRVSTPTATIGIRGTDFESIQVDTQSIASGSSLAPGNYCRVYTGRTVVEGRSGASGAVEVGANQTAFAPNAAYSGFSGAGAGVALLKVVPQGLFLPGRFDGGLPAVQREGMRAISDMFKDNMPPELRELIPDLSSLPRRK